MHETPEDLAWLQDLLDGSRSAAGPHLREVFADDLRLTAVETAALLDGMRVVALATASAAGEPFVAPVDGILYRGRLHFGSSHDALRTRHLAERPAVSAAWIDDERHAVVVHGRAVPVSLDDPAEAGLRACLVEVYGPRFGEGWIDWAASSAVYHRIEPRRMYASRLPEG
ncbi:MAG: pyridoxamine 5'-phosphate oxidase family protein [Chloroflexi bacterium]|jgi:nitroimidazol reductase NimA-like FMN-containing flavoprotein (pyridoxamine 5'-phosphate oxidase superfamily)|nr:pyridoxamine 5'-phosphate oxidase family protein [Chloroflexota bacterium]